MNATNFYMKFNNLHGEGFVTNEIWVKDGKSRSKSSTVASLVLYLNTSLMKKGYTFILLMMRNQDFMKVRKIIH